MASPDGTWTRFDSSRAPNAHRSSSFAGGAIAAIDIAAADVAEPRVVVARELRAFVINAVPEGASIIATETALIEVAGA